MLVFIGALAEHSQMSTHMPGFQSISGVLHPFVLAELASSSIRVNNGYTTFVPLDPGMWQKQVDSSISMVRSAVSGRPVVDSW